MFNDVTKLTVWQRTYSLGFSVYECVNFNIINKHYTWKDLQNASAYTYKTIIEIKEIMHAHFKNLLENSIWYLYIILAYA